MNPRTSLLTLFPYTTLFRSLGDPSVERLIRQYAVAALRKRNDRDRTTKQYERCVLVTDDAHASSGSRDRKSTRLNSSHVAISYAVFCLKKKTHTQFRS